MHAADRYLLAAELCLEVHQAEDADDRNEHGNEGGGGNEAAEALLAPVQAVDGLV